MSVTKVFIIGADGVMGGLLRARIMLCFPEYDIDLWDKNDEIVIPDGTPENPNMVIVSTPVLEIPKVLAKIQELNPKHTYVNEIGSVKASIPFIWFAKHAPVKDSLFFDSVHPMVGPLAKDWNEMNWSSKQCLFVTSEHGDLTGPNDFSKKFWEDLGFTTKWVSVMDHDRIVGVLSHLSHFMIMEYVRFVKQHLTPEEIALAGTSFQAFNKMAEGAERLGDIYKSSDDLPGIVTAFAQQMERSKELKSDIKGNFPFHGKTKDKTDGTAEAKGTATSQQ